MPEEINKHARQSLSKGCFVFDVLAGKNVEWAMMDIDSDEEGINISHYAQAV